MAMYGMDPMAGYSRMPPLSAPPMPIIPPLTMTDDVIKNMGIARMYGPRGSSGDERCNSIAFSDSGNMCVSAHNDGVLKLQRGDLDGSDPSAADACTEYLVEESGCRLVTYTHHEMCILHAAVKGEAEEKARISYHSLHDNKIIRFFRGHTDLVTGMSMSPMTDIFVTASKDGNFKVWDLRNPSAVASGDIGAKGLSTAAFDNEGLVFGITSSSRTLALYETRMFGQFFTSQKPLLQYTVQPQHFRGPDNVPVVPPPPFPSSISWTGMQFSPDNRYIALATADRGILLVDSWQPNREYGLLNSHPIDPSAPCNISFSPDGKYLATGACDGHVYVYNVSGKPHGIPIGADARDVKLDELAYMPKRWEPPYLLLGEAYKTPEALASAKEAAAGHLSKIYAFILGKWMKKPDAVLPACPIAATAEEQVSRHDGPVRAIAWHPRQAVIASGSHSVAIWTPPAPAAPVAPPYGMYQ